MNVHLSGYSACAVFIVVHVATHGRRAPVTVDELVELCDLPVDAVESLLTRLVAAGVVRRDAGPPDGYSLDRPPEEITLLEIAETIDGKHDAELMLPADFGRRPVQAPGSDPGDGPSAKDQGAPLLKAVGSIASSVLASHTIADLLNDQDDGEPRQDDDGRSKP